MPSRRILILDDEESLREVLAAELRKEGYEVLTMESKLRAFDLLMQWRPDLILSDIKSPSMEGWEFLRWVRSNPYGASVAFIFLTGNSSLANAIKSKQMGADDFISKPYKLCDVLNAMKRELEKREDPIWQPPVCFYDCIPEGLAYCLPWRWLVKRWKSAMANSPYRTAVLQVFEWCLDFVVDDGSSLSIGRLVRPCDPRTRYSAVAFQSLINEYGAENGIFYILAPHNDHDVASPRARIATRAEMTDVFASGIFAPDLGRFES